VGEGTLDALFALREGDVLGRGFGEDPETELGELRKRIATVAAEDAALRVTDLKVKGEDVIRVLGIPPSREIRLVLEWLLERVLDDPALNDKEQLEALLPQALAAVRAPSAHLMK
jgi:tRNA nucleotidyltransferase (CCA-adding enzyme)